MDKVLEDDRRNFFCAVETVGERAGTASFLRARSLVFGVCFFMIFVTVQMATAQQESQSHSDQREELVQRLLHRIDQLEGRVKELETQQTAPPSTAPAVARPETATDEELLAHETGHGLLGEMSGSPTLQLRGYGDVQYHLSDERGERNAFILGQLDLFVTSRLSDDFNVLSELVVESGDDNTFAIEIERLLLQYAPSEYLRIGLGRYHTAIGYYNTAYHHGTWFQTATGRPLLFAFEDEKGILPIHNVGITATGAIPSGRFGLHYIAEVGNGRPYTPGEEQVGNVVDNNSGKAINVGLFARPDWLPGLQTGFSLYRDRLSPKGLPAIGQTILAGHLVYQTPTVEWLNEGILMHHNPRGQKSNNIVGFYTQLARQFGKFRPYFRYQYLNAPSRDLLFGEDVGRQNGPTLGLRYDLGEFVALKMQYDHTARRRRSAVNALTMQAAFVF